MFIINDNRYSAHLSRSSKIFEAHSFLLRQIEEDIADSLSFIKKDFANNLIISPHIPTVLKANEHRLPHKAAPFKSFYDLIISIFQLQWQKDPLQTMKQLKSILKNDGMFICAIPGGDSLMELRYSLMQAELDLFGGAHQRTTPMIRPEDLVNLISMAGFKEPVIDVEKITILYPDLKSIIDDLRGMGQTMKFGNPKFSSQLFEKAEEIYADQFANANSELPLTIEIITATAWS